MRCKGVGRRGRGEKERIGYRKRREERKERSQRELKRGRHRGRVDEVTGREEREGGEGERGC